MLNADYVVKIAGPEFEVSYGHEDLGLAIACAFEMGIDSMIWPTQVLAQAVERILMDRLREEVDDEYGIRQAEADFYDAAERLLLRWKAQAVANAARGTPGPSTANAATKACPGGPTG